MPCLKCGARRVARPIPEYVVNLGPDSDSRTAEVYFQRHINVTFEDGVEGRSEFYVSEVVRLNFSLIYLLLNADPECLVFRRTQEEALYNASF